MHRVPLVAWSSLCVAPPRARAGKGPARHRVYPESRRTTHLACLLAHMQLSKIANPGGADRDRTDDIQLAKLALSQLSYGPGYSKTGDTNRGSAAHHVPGASCPRRVAGTCCRGPSVVGLGRFELPTPRLSSVCSNQLSYRP